MGPEHATEVNPRGWSDLLLSFVADPPVLGLVAFWLVMCIPLVLLVISLYRNHRRAQEFRKANAQRHARHSSHARQASEGSR